MTPDEHAAVAALAVASKKHIEILRAVGFEPKDLTEKIEAVEALPGFSATEQCDFEILDAACDVAAFSKMNAYPVEFSPDFFTFAQKLDRLATAINARYPGFNLNCRTSANPETTP